MLYLPTEAAERKTALRKGLLALRKGLSKEEKDERDRALIKALLSFTEFERAKAILLYFPIKGEPDLIPLAESALQMGKSVAFPRCHPSTHQMTFHTVRSQEEMVIGAYGISEPPETAPLLTELDRSLCVVPALSLDREGYRLGYGGGYYDRFLTEFKGCSVGLTYEMLCLEELPRDRYDQRVDWIITEKGVRCPHETKRENEEAHP